MRKVIQVKEEDFVKAEYNGYRAKCKGIDIWCWNKEQRRNFLRIFTADGEFTKEYAGDTLSDGVKAINAALQEMFEDLSEEVKE